MKNFVNFNRGISLSFLVKVFNTTRAFLVQNLFFLVLLSVVAVLSYGQMVKMYFWLDSYSVMYYIQQNMVLPFPYHFLVFLGKPLYGLFQLNPEYYFLTAIFLYLTANLFVYLLMIVFFKKKLLAFLSTLIFAGGYIGQNALLMFMGDGLVTLPALNITLLMILSFLKFHKTYKKKWLILTCILFFLALEIGPLRYTGIIFLILGMDWILVKKGIKKKIKALFHRGSIFIFLFLIQYFLHPTNYILHYQTQLIDNNILDLSNTLQRINIFNSFRFSYITNMAGSLWNIVFSNYYQDKLYFYLQNVPQKINNQQFWLSGIPSIFFMLIMVVLISFIRYKRFFNKNVIFVFPSLVLFIIIWGNVAKSIVLDRLDQVYTFNGGIFLFTLIIIVFYKKIKYKLTASFTVIYIFSILVLFTLSKPDLLLVSNHRYLIALSFVPTLLTSFFITKELFENGTKLQRISAWIFFLFPLSSMLIFHLLSAIQTENLLISSYGNNARVFFNEIRQYIPEIKKPTSIYIEGDTKDFNYIVGEITRVGFLGSEATLAVNYQTTIDNIFLPEKQEDIPLILKKHREIGLENVFTFIYTKHGLKDTTNGFKKRLLMTDWGNDIPPLNWQVYPDEAIIQKNSKMISAKNVEYKFLNSTLGVYPVLELSFTKDSVNTQLPIQIILPIKAELTKHIPNSYFHLFNRPELAQRSEWQEILSWEISQCKTIVKKNFFDCPNKAAKQQLLNNHLVGNIEVAWEYDSFGTLSEDKDKTISIPLDGKWHDFNFIIPSGGQFLKSLMVKYISFPGIISFKKMKMIYKL